MFTPTTTRRHYPTQGLTATPATQALDADAWAAATFRFLFPAGSIPTRQAINRALDAAAPPVGTQVALHWGSGRAGFHWHGIIRGRCSSGFTFHDGKYGRFVSYVDLWCRDAVLVEPRGAVTRVDAMLHVLHTRMPGVPFGAVGTRIRD